MIKTLQFTIVLILLSLGTSVSAQLVNFEQTWAEYLNETKTVYVSDLVKPAKEQKGNYLKYHLMSANTFFCSDQFKEAKEMMDVVRTFDPADYKAIPGFEPRFDDLATKMVAYEKINELWLRFLLRRDVTIAELDAIEKASAMCEKGTLAKYSVMPTNYYYCQGDMTKAFDTFEKKVITLADKTSLDVTKVKGLEEEIAKVKKICGGLKLVGKGWKDYMDTDVSQGFDEELMPLVKCYAIPNMKIHVLNAATDICKKGSEALNKINELKETNTHEIPADLASKIAWLEKEAGNYNGDAAALGKVWNTFVSTGKVGNVDGLMKEYCHKDDQIKALLLDAFSDICAKGQKRLDEIKKIIEEHNPPLGADVKNKISELEIKLDKIQAELDALNTTWGEFIASNDTLTGSYKLEEFYCDKIAQVKSWTIKGHLNACSQGQAYLDKIKDFQVEHSLTFDKELACRVQRLKIKVWDCRYWELVMQARKETHAERERFGPESGRIMYADLNGDKQACETTVQYQPLGNIGIKYVIAAHLCENIDLAKMGDPLYYKKIATWVDNEVLAKYCQANMRCKKDFNIYIEGHSDGWAFKGAYYKDPIDIPVGTTYTHYWNGETKEVVIEKAIMQQLKSNKELALARAWTVKKQLDFMGVPITVGAWEHPESEKGGQFRKIEIELNIHNLLLDFYEKRLNELLEQSGIGERPKEC